jgi:hypothetical protein
MKRSTVGSLLSVGLLLVAMMPKAEGAPAPVVEAARASIAAPEPVATAAVTPVNAGLKAVTTPDVGTTGSCPEGMVEVEGDYCPQLEQTCLRWMDPEGVFPRRCTEFAKTGACQTKTVKKHFCIDRFEYPNKVGEKPIIFKSWYEAADTCKAQGKRLCGDSEWTLACEGAERLPYPYGYERNAQACNIDKSHPDVNEKALENPQTRQAEIDRLWQGEPSGSRESCVSPFGAFDMTGNVDEWVVNEEGKPYKSGLKGGYWGPVRDRCRPMTTVHNEQFAFYQIGFRCCGDVPAPSAAKPAAPAGAPAPSENKKVPSTNPAPGTLTTGT